MANNLKNNEDEEDRVLYLVPMLLSENDYRNVLSENVIKKIYGLRQFIVENVRTTRRYLKTIAHPKEIDELHFRELNEHTTYEEIANLLLFIKKENTGLMSEAGVPCVADPGSEIIRLAHENNIKVVPLLGPSSILMALMASGLNGQCFAFSGYLPTKREERKEKLRALEKRSIVEKQTQIFMETPYRNMQLLSDILTCCRLSTKLTIAADITGKNEFIKTKTIKQWKENLPELNKIPAVFLLQG